MELPSALLRLSSKKFKNSAPKKYFREWNFLTSRLKNSLYFRKWVFLALRFEKLLYFLKKAFLILQEETFRAQKVKKSHSEKLSYISRNETF